MQYITPYAIDTSARVMDIAVLSNDRHGVIQVEVETSQAESSQLEPGLLKLSWNSGLACE